jgi:surfeit locus 1 family protein
VRPAARPLAAGTLALLFFCIFVGLGTWQVERRTWKLELIDRVERRVHSPPVGVPPRAEWPGIKAASHEYRHVQATGRFLPASQTRVQALTDLGPGFWLLAALSLDDGSIVLVNRGFIAAEPPQRTVSAHGLPAERVTITGLLRMPEPRGTFLRRNDPKADRWYSRDVEAIAAARGLDAVAPYFIDADAVQGSGGAADAPVGGLTVIAFPNNHLIYAITWYTLALMIPAALWFALRERE